MKPTIDKYVATTDDFDYGAVPDYDDPDANGEGKAVGALPQYDDPEE